MAFWLIFMHSSDHNLEKKGQKIWIQLIFMSSTDTPSSKNPGRKKSDWNSILMTFLTDLSTQFLFMAFNHVRETLSENLKDAFNWF